MRHTAARLTIASLAVLTAVTLAGCSGSGSSGDAAQPSAPSSTPASTSAGFKPSATLPDNWPTEVLPIAGFDLVGTFDKLAPATGATYTATWQAKGEAFDTLEDAVADMVDAGYKQTGKFESEPDADPQTVSYTLTKGDWVVAYTATYSNGSTVVNQMLIPSKPAPASSKPAKDKAKTGSPAASPAQS